MHKVQAFVEHAPVLYNSSHMLIPFWAIVLVGITLMFVTALLTFGAMVGVALGVVVGMLIALSLAGYLLGVIALLLSKLRPRSYQTVVAEYETPHLLEPAELGYLFDTRSRTQEFLATILSLAKRQAIKITAHENNNPLFSVNSGFGGTVSDIDSYALAWIRQEKHISWREISQTDRHSVHSQVGFEETVKNSVQGKGYIKAYGGLLNPTSNFYTVVAWVVAAVGACVVLYRMLDAGQLSYRQVDRLTVILPGMAVLVLLSPLLIQVLLWSFRQGARRPFKLTEKARQHWKDIAGYRLFLKTVEFSRLEVDPDPYDASLPYAVALGFEPDLNELARHGSSK